MLLLNLPNNDDYNSYKKRTSVYLGERELLSSKIFALNLLTNKIDSSFVSNNYFTDLKVARDTLFGFKKEKGWYVYINDNWHHKEIYSNKFHKEFMKSNLSKYFNVILENKEHYVYSYDQGEFGSGVFFLDKQTGEISGINTYAPLELKQIKSQYYFKSDNYHMCFQSLIGLINNSKGLDYIQSDLAHINNNTIHDYFQYSNNHVFANILSEPEYFDNQVEKDSINEFNNMLHNFPDTLLTKYSKIIKETKYCETDLFLGPTFKYKNQVHHVFYDYNDSTSQIYTQTSKNGVLDTTQKHFNIVDVSNRLNDVHFKGKSIVGLTNNTIVIVSNDHIKRYTFKK